MSSASTYRALAVIVLASAAGPVLPAPVSITVPELRFTAGQEAGAEDARPVDVPTSGTTTISVPDLIYRSGEATSDHPTSDTQVAAEADSGVGGRVVVRTPGLRFDVDITDDDTGDVTEAGETDHGVATVRTAPLLYRPASIEGGADPESMTYASFDTGAISGTRLGVDAATVSTDGALEVSYRGLPVEGRYRLLLWLLAESEPRLYRETRTVEGETSGTWRPELAVAGPYQICVAFAGNDADARRAPANAEP